MKLLFIYFIVLAIACNNEPTNVVEVQLEDSNKALENITSEKEVDTVNNPRVVTPMPDGSVLLTAETGKGVGPAIKYMPEWRAFGWFTSADSVIWEVDIKDAAEYEVSMEWSVDDKEAGKTFVLNAPASTLEGKVGRSGSWETFKTEKIGSIKLQSGRQNITFKSKTKFSKDGALLDLRNLKLVKKSS